MKKILILGAGQLGKALAHSCEEYGYEHKLVEHSCCDVADRKQVQQVWNSYNADYVVNCAAYTNVEGAEDNIDAAKEVNVKGVYNLINEIPKEVPLISFSSDYVFDGTRLGAYVETDEKNPLNNYGVTKHMGEELLNLREAHYNIRTTWLYGDGKNFVRSIVKNIHDKAYLNVVSDQIGALTNVDYLATSVTGLFEKQVAYGTYHLTALGYCSWYDLACIIREELHLGAHINPLLSDQTAYKAKRPKNSVLSNVKWIKAGLQPLPHFYVGLEDYIRREFDGKSN